MHGYDIFYFKKRETEVR